jgi:nitroreductase
MTPEPSADRAPQLELSLDELLSTTRAVRKRLDFERPVPRSVLEECLALAVQAPSGSNTQLWDWVFVEDPETRAKLAAIYRTRFDALYRDGGAPADYASGDPRGAQAPKVSESAAYLADTMQNVPVLLVPCIAGRPDSANSAGLWGSLLPAVWSFMLALRARGLGSAWTTMHLGDGGEREAAELLGIPYESVSQGGLFPIAYTKGTSFRPVPKRPLESITHWDRW